MFKSRIFILLAGLVILSGPLIFNSANRFTQAEVVTTPSEDDDTPPIVSNVRPSGTIRTDTATVSADYSDNESDIDLDSVTILLDGEQLDQCAVTPTRVSCVVTGLTAGQHNIEGSVGDNAGNVGTISGGFNVESPTPTSPKRVDEVLLGLDWGSIAFSAPSAMRFKQTQVVELLLSPTLTTDELEDQLKQKAGAEAATIQVSNRMEATLTGTGFSIKALTPDLQAVSSQQPTRWRWEVTATEPGSRDLHLSLSAYIDVAGRDTPLVVRTFDRNLQVEIAISQRLSDFLRSNWQWLWAVILVPLAGYFWRRWNKKRKQQTGEVKKSKAKKPKQDF